MSRTHNSKRQASRKKMPRDKRIKRNRRKRGKK